MDSVFGSICPASLGGIPPAQRAEVAAGEPASPTVPATRQQSSSASPTLVVLSILFRVAGPEAGTRLRAARGSRHPARRQNRAKIALPRKQAPASTGPQGDPPRMPQAERETDHRPGPHGKDPPGRRAGQTPRSQFLLASHTDERHQSASCSRRRPNEGVAPWRGSVARPRSPPPAGVPWGWRFAAAGGFRETSARFNQCDCS
jgi:hypothetical protein